MPAKAPRRRSLAERLGLAHVASGRPLPQAPSARHGTGQAGQAVHGARRARARRRDHQMVDAPAGRARRGGRRHPRRLPAHASRRPRRSTRCSSGWRRRSAVSLPRRRPRRAHPPAVGPLAVPKTPDHVYQAQTHPPKVAGHCDYRRRRALPARRRQARDDPARLEKQLPPMFEVVDYYADKGVLHTIDGDQPHRRGHRHRSCGQSLQPAHR